MHTISIKPVLFLSAFIVLLLALVRTNGLYAQTQPTGETKPSEQPPAAVNPPKEDTKNKKKRYVIFPVIVKSPEYLWGAGGAGTYYFKMGRDTTVRSSNVKIVSFYTLRKQLVFGSESTIYFPSERWILHILASYSHFPDRFWGLGDFTPSSNQEAYAITQASTTPQLLREMLKNFYMGAGYDFQNVFDFDYNRGGQSLFDKENITGRNGGKISGPSFLLTYDNRDNAFSPAKGFYAQYLIGHYDNAFGSSFNFTVQSLDIRKFFPLKKERVIAMQFNLISNTGNVPVRSLATMGTASYMRGYYDGRYADKNLIAFQTELRTPVYKNFGIVIFGGVGKVGESFSQLWDFTGIRPTIGAGLRYALRPKEKLNLRVDGGWGKQSQGTYINIGEAF